MSHPFKVKVFTAAATVLACIGVGGACSTALAATPSPVDGTVVKLGPTPDTRIGEKTPVDISVTLGNIVGQSSTSLTLQAADGFAIEGVSRGDGVPVPTPATKKGTEPNYPFTVAQGQTIVLNVKVVSTGQTITPDSTPLAFTYRPTLGTYDPQPTAPSVELHAAKLALDLTKDPFRKAGHSYAFAGRIRIDGADPTKAQCKALDVEVAAFEVTGRKRTSSGGRAAGTIDLGHAKISKGHCVTALTGSSRRFVSASHQLVFRFEVRIKAKKDLLPALKGDTKSELTESFILRVPAR